MRLSGRARIEPLQGAGYNGKPAAGNREHTTCSLNRPMHGSAASVESGREMRVKPGMAKSF